MTYQQKWNELVWRVIHTNSLTQIYSDDKLQQARVYWAHKNGLIQTGLHKPNIYTENIS